MPYLGRQPGVGVRNRYIYTATASQTTFSGADDNGATLAYDDGAYVDVYLNGVLLIPVTDYAATTKTSVVLTSGAAASDLLEILAYEISSIADTVSKANGGTFDGAVTVNNNFVVDNGTIKLDGNHPVGTGNVALGDTALDSNVSGASNTAIGADALTANTASNNTAVGYQAGYSGTTGGGNALLGYQAGYAVTGINNVAIGNIASGSGTLAGNYNVVVGYSAGRVTTGADNTFVGALSGNNNTSGNFNTALGRETLQSNTTATRNTAVGYQAGYSLTTGTANVAIGDHALDAASTTNNNTAVGTYALSSTTGQFNTAIGTGAGDAITTGSKNTILGGFNGNQGGLDIRTSSNNIVLSDGDGNPKAWWDSGYNCKLRMGSGGGTNTMKYNTSTYEVTFDTSSARYKENIRDSIYGLNAVLSLSAKQFEYKKDGRSDIGLIAEEVVSVIPELVGTDADGRPDSVTYDRMVSVLVKAIQELSAKNDALEARITQLETP